MECGLNFNEWFFRLVLAVALGGIVGFERQYRGWPAGRRTHILVCLGSTLVTLAGVCLIAGQPEGNEIIRKFGLLPEISQVSWRLASQQA